MTKGERPINITNKCRTVFRRNFDFSVTMTKHKNKPEEINKRGTYLALMNAKTNIKAQ